MIPSSRFGVPFYRVRLTHPATGLGVTGILNTDANLRVAWIREDGHTVVVASGAAIEPIATVGIYVAPTLGSRVRFREVSAANLPGLYELQLPGGAHTLPGNSIQLRVWDVTEPARWSEMWANIAVASPADMQAVQRDTGRAGTWNAALGHYAAWGGFGALTPSGEHIPWAVWGAATRTLTATADSAGITTLLARVVGTIAAGTHLPHSGDAFARLGAAGAGLTALGDARLANLDAPVGGVPGLVWDRPLAGHTTTGSTGSALSTAGIPPEVTAAITRIDAGVATLQATGLTAPSVSTAVKVRLVRGYDYLASAGTAAELRASGWPVLTGATIDMAEPEAPHARFAVGSVAVAGAGEQVIRFEFDDAFTSGLMPGMIAKRLRAVLPGGAVVHLGDIVLEVA